MKLVIDIPEELYKEIYSDAEIMIYGGMRSGKTLLATLLRAIRNGTPLPQGHGRLIDIDAVWNEYPNKPFIECITDAPTIIEADRIACEEAHRDDIEKEWRFSLRGRRLFT